MNFNISKVKISIWGLAFGYFAFYVPYSATTKALSKGLIPGSDPISGFEILPGEHPICPVMLHDAKRAQEMSARLMDEGIYCIGFFYPVVPQGQARIRLQISAAHTDEQKERLYCQGKALEKQLTSEFLGVEDSFSYHVAACNGRVVMEKLNTYTGQVVCRVVFGV